MILCSKHMKTLERCIAFLQGRFATLWWMLSSTYTLIWNILQFGEFLRNSVLMQSPPLVYDLFGFVPSMLVEQAVTRAGLGWIINCHDLISCMSTYSFCFVACDCVHADANRCFSVLISNRMKEGSCFSMSVWAYVSAFALFIHCPATLRIQTAMCERSSRSSPIHVLQA